ncbi:hypothetical protein AK812_SmicGene48057, partial [Symbiodinium microadriaticum]
MSFFSLRLLVRHVLCRVSGHMASLAFALTMLPVAK